MPTKLYRRRPQTVEVWKGADAEYDDAPEWVRDAIGRTRIVAKYWVVMRTIPDGAPVIIGPDDLLRDYEEIEYPEQRQCMGDSANVFPLGTYVYPLGTNPCWPNGPLRPE